jgi:hypothetical protein
MTDVYERLDPNRRLARVLRVGVVTNSVAGWTLVAVGVFQERLWLCVMAATAFGVALYSRWWLRLVLDEIRKLEGS